MRVLHAWLGTLALPAANAGAMFDAPRQDNEAAQQPHPLAGVLGRMRRSGGRAIVANSRPNVGTERLAEARDQARAAGVAVIPRRAPVRQPRRLHAPVRRPSIRKMWLSELDRSLQAGPLRGLDACHLYGSANARR